MNKLSGNELAIAIENQELKAKLAKYESIVKTVDVDNLPDDEVIVISPFGGLVMSALIKNRATGKVTGNYSGANNITHYIEQKDLMELFK